MVRTWRGCDEIRPSAASHRGIDVQHRPERRAANELARVVSAP